MSKFTKKSSFAKTLTLDHVMTEGKYVGMDCESICYRDPDYLLWLDVNNTYSISKELRVLAEECKCYSQQRDYQCYLEYTGSINV